MKLSFPISYNWPFSADAFTNAVVGSMLPASRYVVFLYVPEEWHF